MLIHGKRKNQASAISVEDIKCAISKVKRLDNRFSVICAHGAEPRPDPHSVLLSAFLF